jgi:hypothetical protein
MRHLFGGFSVNGHITMLPIGICSKNRLSDSFANCAALCSRVSSAFLFYTLEIPP